MKLNSRLFKLLLLLASLVLISCGSGGDSKIDSSASVTQCNDGADNDNDGFIDLDDPGCSSSSDSSEQDALTNLNQCSDGLDNDNDGFVDLEDYDCINSGDDDEGGTTVSAKHDAERANSYDNEWDDAWVENFKRILATNLGLQKTNGKVLQVGDSMTHASAYGRWARTGKGQTADDSEIVLWMHGDSFNTDNGWYYSTNAITAGGGATWNASFIDDIFVDPQLNDAQFAVVMFNTNDINFIEQRLNQFIDAGIAPVLSTIPPRTNLDSYINISIPYNKELKKLAKKLSLPIIDFEQEILLRRPDGSWENTLIGPDGVHPSSPGVNGIYDAESDPYLPGGNPSTHETGDALLFSGYLLRTWLTVQKMKEIYKKVN